MARRWNNRALLIKTEGTYNTDPTPTVSANGILARNVVLSATKAEQTDERGMVRGGFGDQGMLGATFTATLTFEVEFQSSGTAGTAPAFGPLLRACGMAETTTAGTRVDYTPISDDQESVTCWFYLDGQRSKLTGARGDVELMSPAGKIPRLKFTLTGFLQPVTDVAFPASVTVTAFKAPLLANSTNTTLSLAGATRVMHDFSWKCGNKVEPYLPVDGQRIEIVDRMSTASALIESVLAATYDFDAAYRARTRVAFTFTHGVSAGYIAKIAATKCELGELNDQDVAGIVCQQTPLRLVTDAADDEFTLTFQ